MVEHETYIEAKECRSSLSITITHCILNLMSLYLTTLPLNIILGLLFTLKVILMYDYLIIIIFNSVAMYYRYTVKLSK